MQFFKAKLIDRLRYLAYIVKEADPDDLEIVLTSDHRPRNFSNSTSMVNYVLENFSKGAHAGCQMDQCFDRLFDRLKGRLNPAGIRENLKRIILRQGSTASRRISVYFLTDAAWADKYVSTNDTTLASTLEKLRQEVQVTHGKDHRWISLQFIRFGHDKKGIQMLQTFDDELVPPDL